jgi:translation elongation factor EF-Ts
LGHILSRFPVKASLTVYQSYIDKNVSGSRFVRLYVLDDSYVKKYYKEKNGLLVLIKKDSPKTKSLSKNGD